jgi:hypothetical protein
MFTADQIFAHLVYLALPAVTLYPLIYGLTTRWWESWIGRALLVKAIGVFVLIVFSALFQAFGPNYWGRDVVRIGGMVLACIGFYLALFSLIQVKREARRNRRR